MAQQKETAPSGIAGLVRYEEEKSKVNMKPEYVFGGIAAIAEIELLVQGLFFIAVAFGVLFGLMLYWMYGKGLQKSQHAKTVSAQSAVHQHVSQPSQPAPQEQAVQQDVAQQ